MNLPHPRTAERLAALLWTVALAALAQTAVPPADPFMGDWQGTLKTADGRDTPLVAQVIAWGKGEYQANLLDAFDQRAEPVAVLQGHAEDGALVFGDALAVRDGQFAGRLEAKRSGTLALRQVERPSPTLGAKPPAGAVVLLDDTGNLDGWTHPGRRAHVVDLRRELGGEQKVAYLRNRLFVPTAQEVVLEVGSDDGIAVSLNGAPIHKNNVPRGVTPGQDRVKASLQQGWNELMLKITQGGGDWGACLRVVTPDGQPLTGLQAGTVPKSGTALDTTGIDAQGYVIAWEAAGPYALEGRDGMSLMDEAFPPEKPGPEEATWRVVNEVPDAGQARWKHLEGGVVEVSGGNLMTKRTFGDHTLHVEFRTPFMPEARGQGRGNSGVYVQGRYEIQVLDSYGLEGADNECGGIYHASRPRANMCAPPLQWQTYDITFTAPRFGADGKPTQEARMTVLHNGVAIHENVNIPGATPGGLDANVTEPGPLFLQDHGNAVQFRNVWVVGK